MKKRIIYVGTLIDLAAIFEPDVEAESIKEQAKEQKRLAILLRTMVNGYMLEVNNEGYMYFNAQSLLEGFMVHIGLERLESMTKEEIKDMLNSLKDGSAVKKLQAEVTELKALVDDQKKQIRDLKKTIKELKED